MSAEISTDFLYEKDVNNGDVTITLQNSNIENSYNSLALQKLFWAVDILENFETSKSMRVASVNNNELINPESNIVVNQNGSKKLEEKGLDENHKKKTILRLSLA